jgi:hypothetical protein
MHNDKHYGDEPTLIGWQREGPALAAGWQEAEA